MPGRALTILQIGSRLSRVGPLQPMIAVAERVGAAVGPRLMRGKARQLERHMQRVAPDGPASDSMRRGFGSYGRYWIESFRIPYLTDRQIDRGFSFIGYDKIEQVRADGLGPILVLPHLGGWEWAAAWLGRIAKVEVTAVVEQLEPPEVFDWFARLRQAFGVNVVALGPRAMVEVSAAVKRRDVVCLLSDRDIGGNGVEVDFFGERTTLPAGPALLARRTGAPLMPTAVLFRGRQRICLVGDPIWPDQLPDPLDAPDGDQAEGRRPGKRAAKNQQVMQLVAERLEELVSVAPDQWHLLEPNWPSDREVS